MDKKKTIVYLVAFAAFFGPFTQTIYTPMMPEIQAHFATSTFLVNLTISIFTVFLALMQIVYGPLVDARGRRKVLLPSILVYIAASVGAAMASTIEWLLVFRSLQAIGIAAGSVVATTVIGDLYEGRERGRAMGTFQMLVALGPVVGPVVGGFLGQRAGFHSVFWVLASTALLLLAANYRWLPETKPEQTAGDRFSVRDFGLVLRVRTVTAIVVLGFVQYYAMYNFLVFLPGMLTRMYGLSVEQKGLVFLPLSLFIVIGSFLGGRIQERFEPRRMLVTTAALNVATLVVFEFLAPVSLPLLIVSTSLFGLCLGLSLPVQTTILADAVPQKRATVVGVYNFSRYLGMAAGPMVGSLLLPFGERAVFLFAAVAFAGVVVFAGRMFAAAPVRER